MKRLIIFFIWLAAPSLVAGEAYAEQVEVGLDAIVRIEGPVQGSGTLFNLKDKTIVLTAWHVLKSVREREEVDIVMNDGKSGPIKNSSIMRIGNVDMAIAEVDSISNIPDIYIATEPATSGTDAKVYGFPNNANGKMKISEGMIFSNANIGIDQGYQLIYSMETQPGMSGGPIIDGYGNIIGIHGRGELNEGRSNFEGKIVKTRLNNGVPISYLLKYFNGEDPTYIPQEPTSIDDLNALTYRMSRTRKDYGGEEGIKFNSMLIKLLSKLDSSDFRRKYILPRAYNNRHRINLELGRYDNALSDLDLAIKLTKDEEHKELLYGSKPIIYERSGQKHLAIKARSELIDMYPNKHENYTLRGHSYNTSQQPRKALEDFLKVIELGSKNADSYNNVASAYDLLDEKDLAMKYIERALTIDPNHLGSLRRKASLMSAIPGKESIALDIAHKVNKLSTEHNEMRLQSLNLIATINLRINNLPEAAKALREMKLHWPNSHKYLSSSAEYFYQNNQLKKAIRQLSNSINTNPPEYSLPGLHGRRGIYWQNLKEYDEAISDFTKAISMGGDGKFLYSFRGHSFAAQGNFILACADWKRSVRMGGEFDVGFINDFCQ